MIACIFVTRDNSPLPLSFCVAHFFVQSSADGIACCDLGMGVEDSLFLKNIENLFLFLSMLVLLGNGVSMYWYHHMEPACTSVCSLIFRQVLVSTCRVFHDAYNIDNRLLFILLIYLKHVLSAFSMF